jgi:hypothetical protein
MPLNTGIEKKKLKQSTYVWSAGSSAIRKGMGVKMKSESTPIEAAWQTVGSAANKPIIIMGSSIFITPFQV